MKRDEKGLIEGVEYKFDEDGFIDWRAMVDPKEVYPNKEFFLSQDKEVPKSAEGLADYECLIKLGGLKKLLRLRGFKEMHTNITENREGYVAAECQIVFIGNYETGGEDVVFTAQANATSENTDGFGEKFLEAIAENRAFVRCIRNFLNINICGADEIDKSSGKERPQKSGKSNAFSPQGSLAKAAEEAGYPDYESFKQRLREYHAQNIYQNPEVISTWDSFEDIKAKDARQLIALLKKHS